MKTSELSGAALDWAVAKCEGVKLNEGNTLSNDCDVYSPSTDWAQGGPIIDREWIELLNGSNIAPHKWAAVKYDENGETVVGHGSTPLIAAMRCYVASKLGDTVKIPQELQS